ncbi:MAG: ATP-dependent sacrificial sulfur transferase LarE [Candidatus Heimdallarchaeota archaeon]|nr:ATP-dependent sacrificial sulfur transferase LarE [Candidatus Heimdallarchaeota archaeon]MCK4254544.1 ATP-dependent sacrificial sulfur transferase LarE [Candidatus Heimdallarchaeota archaeon]
MVNEIISKLQKYFHDKNIVVAFSGGLDSTVLLEIARKTSQSVLPVIAKSSLVPAKDIQYAVDYLTNRKIKYKIVSVNPLDHPEVAENNPRRCYYCKTLIFQSIIKEIEKLDYDFIVEGSNVTDLTDYRPGLKAMSELGIKSPYLEMGITKETIKQIASKMELEVVNKPATTCLATRIPYGQQITKTKIDAVEKAENIIQSIFGVSTLRLRAHDEIARIEVPVSIMNKFLENERRERLIKELKEIGFNYITIDLEGYRQGSMNIPLPKEVNEYE